MQSSSLCVECFIILPISVNFFHNSSALSCTFSTCAFNLNANLSASVSLVTSSIKNHTICLWLYCSCAVHRAECILDFFFLV